MLAKDHKSSIRTTEFVTLFVLGLAISAFLGQFPTVRAQASSSNHDMAVTRETELASLYLPVLQFKDGERFFPVDVTYHLNNSVLKRWVGQTSGVEDQAPTISTIAAKSQDYFLANKLGSLAAIAADYQQKKGSLGYVIYSRVTSDSATAVVQYWFFYAYNDAPLNDHEGDWEMIEILLDNTDNPTAAVYSQHLKGQKALWGDVEKADGTHPKVYVAKGSHANYFRPYQGKLGLENDIVGADGFTLGPSDLGTSLNLVPLEEIDLGGHVPSQDWLMFGGRWGNWAMLADALAGFAGPYGPGQGDNSNKWYTPVSWGESMPVANGTWFTLCWLAANFLLIFVGVTVLLCLYKVWRIVKLKKTSGLRLPAFLKTRAVAGIALGVVALFFAVAAMFLPWYAVRANVQTPMLSTQGETELLVMDGQRGLLVNLLVSGNGPTPAFSLQIPAGLLLLVGIVFSLLDIIGLDTAKSLGNKYLRGGITFVILFIVLILLIVQLTSMIQSLANMMGVALPPEATEMAQAVAQQPLQGAQTMSMGDFGSVYLSWGLGLGAYMLLAAAILKLIGGIILRGTPNLPSQQGSLQPPPPPPSA